MDRRPGRAARRSPTRRARSPAETTFVVTGAAGSIVSAITADLAAASGGTFHLLDLVPEPDPDDPDLERFAADRDGLKRELAERIKERGERPDAEAGRARAGANRARPGGARTPSRRSARRAARRTGTRRTSPIPRRWREALAPARESGASTSLVHAAGLEVSHFLPDKPQAEYDLVFDVKADGWFNLLYALRDAEVGTAVAFSSIAARFGNAGQTDYSAANDLLCKSISSLRRGGPPARGIAIDWTAWAEIGMASRGSIPKMMEMAGIDMLPPGDRRADRPPRADRLGRRRRGPGRGLTRHAGRRAPCDRGHRRR